MASTLKKEEEDGFNLEDSSSHTASGLRHPLFEATNGFPWKLPTSKIPISESGQRSGTQNGNGLLTRKLSATPLKAAGKATFAPLKRPSGSGLARRASLPGIKKVQFIRHGSILEFPGSGVEESEIDECATAPLVTPRRLSQQVVEELEIDRLVTAQIAAIANTPHQVIEEFAFDRLVTAQIPAITPVKELTGEQEEATPAINSEVSGAANSAALIGLGSILGNVMKYGNSLLIQRGFGAGDFGLYTLGMSTITLAVSIFNLGLDDAMVRYVAVYRSKKQKSLLKGLAVFCTMAASIAGIIGALLVVFLAPSLAAIRRSPNLLPLLLLLVPLIPLSSMQGVWTGGLQGFKAFKWRILTQRLVVPGVLGLLLIPIIFFARDLTLVALATFVSVLVGALSNLYFFVNKVLHSQPANTEEYQLREWLGFAIPNFLTSILDTVLEAVDTILLAYLVTSNVAVGQYAASIKISAFISVPLQSLNVMFAPTIAELYSKGEQQKLAAMFKVVTNWIIIFSLPICLIAILFSRPLLGISGGSFLAAWPLLIVLAVGNMINSGTGSVGYMLLMTGHQKLSFINSLVAVVVNIGLGIILTPMYGAMGTAIATGLALAIVNLMRLLQVRLLLKIHPYRWDIVKSLGAGLISSLLVGFLLYVFNLAHVSYRIYHFNLSLELLLLPVFLGMYVALLILFKFSPEDKIVVDKLRKKMRRRKK